MNKTKCYTAKGDNGQSGGLSKSHPFFEALGSIDCVQSYIGIIRSELYKMYCAYYVKEYKNIFYLLKKIQNDLFKIQAYLYNNKVNKLKEKDLTDIEEYINKSFENIYKVDSFILSSGYNLLSAQCDYARTLARKAERDYWKVDSDKNNLYSKYMNRFSSLFYVLARYFDTNPEKVEY